MSDEQLAIIIARTDAAACLLMAILVEKGVINVAEMEVILARASDSLAASSSGAVVASVFLSMKSMLDENRNGQSSQHARYFDVKRTLN